jgi:ATP-dependent DNA ligase
MIVLNSASNPPKPCFESVMARFSAQKEATIVQLKEKLPVHLAVWDILYLNDKALVNQKLEQRLELLYKIVEPSNHISVTSTHNNGNRLYQEVLKHGLEGIVSKKIGSS